MSSEVPEEWRTVRLGDVAAINPENLGQRTSPDAAFGYVDISQIDQPGALTGWMPTKFATAPSRARRVVREGDILVSTVRPYLRAFAMVPPSNVSLVASTGFAVVRAHEGSDQDFLFQHIMGADFVEHLKSRMTGSNYPAVSADDVANYELSYPPLDEQRRIAEVLRALDDAIVANRAMVSHISRVRAATLFSAFEESDWEPVRLGDLGRWSSGGTPSKADDTLWNGDVPWICPRDMKSPVVTRAQTNVSSKAIGGPCKLVPKGTLLLVVRGMILAKAIPAATTAMVVTHNQDIKAFQPNGRAVPKFVQICLQHKEHDLLQQVNTATHGTKKLDAQTIADFEVPLPDLPTQLELSETISDMDLAMVRAGEEHIRLAAMRAALRSDLLSGRVRVPA